MRRQKTGSGSDAPGRQLRPSTGFTLLSGSQAEPPFLPLSLSLSLSSSVRQGSSAAGPTRPLPAVAAAGRCRAGQPFSGPVPPPLPPPLQETPPSGAASALGGRRRDALGCTSSMVSRSGRASGRGMGLTRRGLGASQRGAVGCGILTPYRTLVP